MNEAEWLAGDIPLAMLDYLGGKTSERKLRLFAYACARRCWRLFRYRRQRDAIELAERFAIGRALAAQVEEARQQAEAWVYDAPLYEQSAYRAAAATLAESAADAARTATQAACQQVRYEAAASLLPYEEARFVSEESAREGRALAQLANEIFGNPFRPSRVEPAWLTYADGAALAMARYIDDGRRFDELPYLADALTDAGCDDDALLRHLREPAGHVPGCWALDLVLGRGGRDLE